MLMLAWPPDRREAVSAPAGGVLYFSNNRRRFRLDPELASLPGCEDITAETLDPDFARRPNVHRCFRFQPPPAAG